MNGSSYSYAMESRTYTLDEAPALYVNLMIKYHQTLAKCVAGFVGPVRAAKIAKLAKMRKLRELDVADEAARATLEYEARGLASDFASRVSNRPASNVCGAAWQVVSSLYTMAEAADGTGEFYFSDESTYLERPGPHRDYCTVILAIGATEDSAERDPKLYKWCDAQG